MYPWESRVRVEISVISSSVFFSNAMASEDRKEKAQSATYNSDPTNSNYPTDSRTNTNSDYLNNNNSDDDIDSK